MAAAAMILMLIAASFLIGCTNQAGALTAPEVKVMHVGGKVMCQDCKGSYQEWISGSEPIKGSKVCLTCMDKNGKIVYYGSDETDERGVFSMTLDKYINGKELKAESCKFRLVSSPHSTCNILTDYAGGASGVMLRQPTGSYRDEVKYELGTFFFTTPACKTQASTSSEDSDEDEGSNY